MTHEQAPRVTVLLPVYNGERFLPHSVESILGQTFGDFELLVVDDGSTDSTPRILSAYDDPRIRIVRNERNLGLVRTLNAGLRLARGELVARQDADDISEPGRLERQVRFLDEHPRVVLVGTDYLRIDEEGRAIGVRRTPTSHVAIIWRLVFVNAFAHSSVMFRRAAVEHAGLYDESIPYGEDYDLWSRLGTRGVLASVPEVLVRYRSPPVSMTSTHGQPEDPADAIRHGNLARLGNDVAGLSANLDWDAAWRLQFGGSLSSIDVAGAARTARQVLVIQRAFARRYVTTPSGRLRHRAGVAWTLARSVARRALQVRDARALMLSAPLAGEAILVGTRAAVARRV